MAIYLPTTATPLLAESRAQLRQQLTLLTDFWNACSELELSIHPGPGRWSRKEILGHLIDSALNNHRRIVGASLAPPPHQLRPYDQDAWVRVADYQHLPCADLLALWTNLNHLILHLIDRIGIALRHGGTQVKYDGPRAGCLRLSLDAFKKALVFF